MAWFKTWRPENALIFQQKRFLAQIFLGNHSMDICMYNDVDIYVYIYIYIYLHLIYIYIHMQYIYIYTHTLEGVVRS